MVLRFFKRSTRKNQDQPEPSLPPTLRATVASFVSPQSIPPMPSAARAAFELSLDHEAETKDFVELLESDESLASRVMKIANSVYYDRGSSSRTLEESVVTIGVDELRALLQSTTLAQVFPSPSPIRAFVWQHDVATGLAARLLASEFGAGNRDLAFITGLMHDIGKLLMFHRFPEKYAQIVDTVTRHGISFQEAELEVFPFSHCETGVLVAEQWRFAPEMIAAIRDHHLPWEDERIARHPLTRLTKTADILAHTVGAGHLPGFQAFRSGAEAELKTAWAEMKTSEARGSEIQREARRLIDNELDLYIGSDQ